MSSAFEGVQWPKGPAVSTEIKDLLAEFYRLADLKDPNSGETMSKHVFAHDAVISMPNVTFTGREEIAGCRKHAWDSVTFRRHTVKGVYVGDLGGKDILVTGLVESHPKEGASTVQGFASRATFDQGNEGKSKMKTYKAWGGKIVS